MHRMDGLLKETHRQSEALERLARLGPLTGTANHHQLSKDLTREMSQKCRCSFIHRADKALYGAKNAGRNRLVYA